MTPSPRNPRRVAASVVLLVACATPTASPPAPAQAAPAPIVAPPVTPPPPARVAAAEPMDPPPAPIAVSAGTPVPTEALPWTPRPKVGQIRDADRLLSQGRPAEALALLAKGRSGPAALLHARAQRLLGAYDRVAAEVAEAEKDQALQAHAQLERGLAEQARNELAAAAATLGALATGDDLSVARRAVVPLLHLVIDSHGEHGAELAGLERVLPPDDLDARGLWLEAQAQVAERAGKADEATALRLQRWVEEPVSLLTPEAPPEGTAPSTVQLLDRADHLLEAHRNEKAIALVESMPAKGLNAAQKCRRIFILGMAARKLRYYSQAEKYLGEATQVCKDPDTVRRASYLQVKVVSIRDGLRALPLMDAFAAANAGHSMVDDVLFWAGDVLQRRSRWEEALAYFKKIVALPEKGDHCAEAAWRLAWIDYRRNRMTAAEKGLEAILADSACTTARADRARAHFWLGRIREAKSNAAALASYRKAMSIEPLGYYSQISLARVKAIAPDTVVPGETYPLPPPPGKRPDLCPGFLAQEPAFARGLELLVRGLSSDAADELRSIPVPEQDVLGSTHATALGVAPRPAKAKGLRDGRVEPCGPEAPLLLLALLLDEAGAHREAHWRLRTDFVDLLASTPAPETAVVWHAAYPLAFRDFIAPAEKEAKLPDLFMQALCREESALDPQAVSWAGAYGLSQLLLSSAQAAGKLVSPEVRVTRAEELLEPALSARLGAVLLGSQVHKLGDNLRLGLAAYNAGDDVAVSWWNRHQGKPFELFAEEMTIKETRGYVKRVLQTYGIYRWLHANESPVLPIEATLPPRS